MASNKAKPLRGLELVMSYITAGTTGVMKGVYTTFGEISLHFLCLILSVSLCTLYYTPSGDVASSRIQEL
jgi:hypothetical protein